MALFIFLCPTHPSVGIRDPVPLASTDNGIRLGLGRAEIEKQFYAAENISRRVLETEALANEDEDQVRKREVDIYWVASAA